MLHHLLITFSIAQAAVATPAVLLSENFNTATERALSARLLKKSEVTLAKSSGPDGSHAIRVAYVPYERGSKRITSNYPLSRRVKTATLSFDVCFEQDFDFRKGGKLHGLGPLNPVTGGHTRKPTQWSARLMFRKSGKVSTYIYDQSPTAKYGIGETSKAPIFHKGTWHRIDLQVSLNSGGKPNGFVHLFIDGKKVASSQHLNIRGIDNNDTLIHSFMFCTFHGGHTPEWSPLNSQGKPTTVYALFDNIIVQEGLVTSPAKP